MAVKSHFFLHQVIFQVMKTNFILFVILIFLAVTGCHPQEKRELGVEVSPMMEKAVSDAPPPPPTGAEDLKQNLRQNVKLVKKGELTISSRDMRQTKSQISVFVKDCQGDIINETMSKNEFFSSIELSLKVRAAQFDRFIQLLDSAGINIVSKNITVEDVTMKFIDDSTRLENKKKLEQKYRDLMARAKDMTDLLQIESKLEEIQSDIEVRETQLKQLENQVAYSQFTIRIEQDDANVSYSDRSKFTYKLGQGLKAGWEGIQMLVVFLFAVWPAYLILLVIYLTIKTIIRKRKKKYAGN